MKDERKKKEQLIKELAEANKRIAELEKSAFVIKQMDNVLQASEIRYRRLFETAQDGILILDADTGQIIDVNPFLIDMLGFSHEEFMGKKLWEIGPFKDIKDSKASFEKLQREEYVRYEDLPLQTKDGRLINVEFVSNVYLVNHHKVIQCNIREITDRKQVEEELRLYRNNLEGLVKERTGELGSRNTQLEEEIIQRKKAEDSLRLANTYNRSLIEASLDPLVTIDAGGKITDVNVATELVTGYTRENLIGTDFSDYFTEPDKARAGYQQVFSKGSVHDYHLEILHRDGHHTPVLYNAAVYKNNSGKIIGVFAAARDITEHKRAEEDKKRLELQLIQAQKIEALGKLAGGIAHDFKNILQPILINAELISDMLPPGTQEREFLEQIIEASQLGKNLVRQISLFKLKEESLSKPIALDTVVHEALNFFKRSLPLDITFRQRIAAKNGLVQADPTQIHQVILNLCTNSVQAIGPGKGSLEVSLRETELTEATPAFISDLNPGRYVKLTVRDTGCGISPETMDRLFDPFFTTRKSDKGTGLGLTVVHEVVKNAGGSILIHSEVGKGTFFDVFFPLILDPPDQIHASSPLVSGKGDKHILLVDDNTADLRSIHQLLVHFGYFVTSTTDPHEALSIFREEPKKFDLLITDQVMPRMRGHELATHVHEIRKDLPVIICSGSEEAIQELQKHQADIHEYIHKPFSKDQLMDAMQRALN